MTVIIISHPIFRIVYRLWYLRNGWR